MIQRSHLERIAERKQIVAAPRQVQVWRETVKRGQWDVNEAASAKLREELSAFLADAIAVPTEPIFDVKLRRKGVALPDGWLLGWLLTMASVTSLTIIPSFVMLEFQFEATVYQDEGTRSKTYRYEDQNLQIVWLPFALSRQARSYGPYGPSARDIAEDAVTENFLRHFARDSSADLAPDDHQAAFHPQE